MNDRQKAFLAIFLGSLFTGAVAAVTKIGLVEIPPLSFAFGRFLLASLFLLPIFATKSSNIRKDLMALTPLSLFATVNIILFVIGIKTTTATIGQMLYAGVPLLTGLIAHYLNTEKLTKQKLLGISVGFVGVGIVVLLPFLEQGEVFSGDLRGNLLIATGVISWSFYMVFSKKAQARYSPFIITSVFILITTVTLAPLFLLELNTAYGWWNGITAAGLLAVAYVALVVTVGGYWLNQYIIKLGGSVFASMGFYLTPVFAFLSAYVLLEERLTPGFLFGGTLALLGIYLTTSPLAKLSRS